MEIFKREKYLNQILENISNKEEILFLVWPRQAWKTTLLKSLTYFGYFRADEVIFLEWNFFIENWINCFKDFIWYLQVNYDLSSKKILIIDEAQAVPNLWDILFQFINQIRRGVYNLKIIVSGSWSLKIFKNLTDSLVGRKYIIYVWPFDFEEFVKAKWRNYFFSDSKVVINEYLNLLKEYFLFWWYPKVALTNDYSQKVIYLKEIYNSFLEKDIRYLLAEKEILNLKKVIFEIAKTIWSQVNFSQIIESVWIKRYEFEKIKFVLENTFIIKSLSPFITWKFKKEVKKKEKFYFVDFGILRLILWYEIDNLDFFKWILVENFVFNQILFNLEPSYEMYFWWSHNEVEIDFILKDLSSWKLKCIDAKQKDKDNIPKWYLNFCKVLDWVIDEFIITTTYLVKTRTEQCKFKFIPYVFSSEII